MVYLKPHRYGALLVERVLSPRERGFIHAKVLVTRHCGRKRRGLSSRSTLISRGLGPNPFFSWDPVLPS